YNVEHVVRLGTLAMVANIVSRKVASEESAVYWNLGDRPVGTKYNEMFKVDWVLLDTGAEMNVCSWALADNAKAGSCMDCDILMTIFNVASGSSRMFGMLCDCKLCFPGPICLHQKEFIAPEVEKTPFALLLGMPAIVSLCACEVFDSQGNLWHKLTSPDGSRSIYLLTCPINSPRNVLEPGILRKKANTDDLEESMDIHSRVIPLILSGFQDAERVLLRALLQYLHDFLREEHPDARGFTTCFYLDQCRNEGMHYNMILGSEQIALSICHAHEFTASDHVPVVLHTCLNRLHADFLHLMYKEGSMFGDDESDIVSEISEGFSGLDSEEDGLESLNLGGSVQGLFNDKYSCSESDNGSFNGFENTTDTESSSRDSGVDSEESCGTTAGGVK
ncbi:hypothetical protein HDU77_000468, partial [Chytriomyces hyalinus]